MAEPQEKPRRTAKARAALARHRRSARSARRDVGRARRQLRAVLGECDASRAVSFRRDGQARARAHRAARIHRRGLARLPARRAAGHGLRLSRARAVRARAGPSLQSEQAPARSVREGARRRAQVGRRAFRLPDRRRRRRPRRSTSATARRSCRSAASSIPRSRGAASAGRWCRGSARSSTKRTCAATRCAIPAVPDELRGKFAGLAVREVVNYIRSLGVTVDRAPAGAGVDRRSRDLVDKGLTNYWGYDTIGFFAPNPRYSATGIDRASSRRWSRTCTTRASKSSSTSSTTTRPKATSSARRSRFKGIDNASYYRLHAGRAALLHQRHRHRQHAEPQPSARAPDGDRLAALLGDRDARRRLPLRSRDDPRARGRTASTRAAAFSTAAGRTRCSRR